jgi:hypothetical protein
MNFNLVKYIKYKNKYINLLNTIKGGNKVPIRIYSFNVLNSEEITLNITFRKIFTKQEFIDLAVKLDSERYLLFRKCAILETIKYFINKKHCIVSLQEVNKDLLDSIIKLFGSDNVRFNIDIDTIKYIRNDVVNIGKKNEYRVTIISDDLEFIESFDIELDNGTAKKNALYTKITLKNNREKIIQNVNVHLHYKSNQANLIEFGKKIICHIDKKIPFYICGDFNKPISNLKSLLDILGISNIVIPIDKIKQDYIDGKLRLTGYTSLDTRDNDDAKLTHHKEEQKLDDNIDLYSKYPKIQNKFGAIIDYFIISSNLEYELPPTILTRVNGKYIYYNLGEIQKIILNSRKTYEQKLQKWLTMRKDHDISDHKPIKAIILL